MNPWRLSLLGIALASTAIAQTDNDTTIRSSTRPRFQVVSGDTVKFGPQLVRLFGIDAPQKGQTCDGGKWLPGPLATKALIDFIAGRPVACNQVDYDGKNNRPVALCFAGGDDLQALMVSSGWAWAYTQFSDQYVDAERRAAAKGLGVHAHRCVPAWEWRAHRRQEEQ
jgi:endonuclease YncB( thermonuclease family)